MLLRTVWFFTAFVLLSTAAHAESTASPSAEPVKEKKICRSQPKTGSFIAKRICHTRAEWKAIEDAQSRVSEQAIDKLRNSRVLHNDD